MTHPFERLSPEQSRRWFWFFLTATLLLMAVLTFIGLPLGKAHTASGGGCDIVSFEVAGTVERSGAIVAAWEAQGVLSRAKWNTWLDYLFLICYPNAVALGLVLVLGRPIPNFWRSAARGLAWAQWVVLASDAVENAALLRILYGTLASPWPQLALTCAIIKFTLLAAGLAGLMAILAIHKR